MCTSLPKLLVLLTCLTLTLGANTPGRVLKCPCSFTVQRQVDPTSRTDNQTFDVLVETVLKTTRFPAITKWQHDMAHKHSSTNVQISHATSSDNHFHSFRQVNVRDSGLFSVTIHHHTASGDVDIPSYIIQLHSSAKQLVCPVVIPQDLPSSRRDVQLLDHKGSIRMSQDEEQDGESPQESPADRPINERIAGGLLASPDLMPFLVSLTQVCPPGALRCSPGCSGTLISSTWVMTAAHCGMRVGARAYVAAAFAGRGSFRTVIQSIPHPQFESNPDDSRYEFDIAVLELDGDATDCPGCDVQPRSVPINFDSETPEVDAFARVAGYGATAGRGRAGRLRQVDVPIVDIPTCAGIYRDILEERQICAGYLLEGGCDSCGGDSGGPLIQYSGSTPVLTGMTSFGNGCANARFPGVYTRPAGHRAWLESTGAEFTENTGPLEQRRMSCEAGEVLVFSRATGAACQPCSFRHMSPGGFARTCVRCPSNFRQDLDNGSLCSCASRPGRGLRRGRCQPCTRGTASPLGDDLCSPCPPDTFARRRGSERCAPCPGAPARSRFCRF